MALVFCASLRVLAIFCRIRFILTLCSDLVPAISLVGSAGGTRTTGEGPDDCGGGEARFGSGGGIDEEGPVGIGGVGGGVVGMGSAAAGLGASSAAGGAAAAAGAAAGSSCLEGSSVAFSAGAVPSAPTSISASFIPGLTVAPSSTSCFLSTPATGDGTGTDVLSVSTSQTTSSCSNASPSCFSHLRSPSEMDSAKAGHSMTFTSPSEVGVT